MSHTVIDSISFKTHIGYNAKHILASDKARAQKLLAGMHPHGPVAFHARLMDHGNDDSPVDIAAAEPDQSIDVTDAVGSVDFFDAYMHPSSPQIRCHLYHAG